MVKKEIEKKIDISQLREYLSCSLPSYMIPSYFIQLEKIPLTTNGKVDFKALPEGESLTSKENDEAPRNEILEGINEPHRLTVLLKKNKVVNEYAVSPVQLFFLLQPHQVTAKINRLFSIRRNCFCITFTIPA